MENTVIQTIVSDILTQTQKNERHLIEQIEQLAENQGPDVFSETLRQLVGKDFPAEKACLYWQEALQLSRLGCKPECNYRGVRSSLLSYLFQVVEEMRDPRVIEADDLASYRHASITDGLTGLHHQAYFKAHLNQLVERLQGTDQGFAVVMLDLDHFKQYNDRCGHLAGDLALRQTADILLKSIRQGDLAVRYGGEEFALILYRLNRPQAAMVTERIRRTIEAFHFSGQENLDRGNLTISGGVVFYPEDGGTSTELIRLADERLYRAKQARNAIYPFNQDQRQARRHPRHSLVELSIEGNGTTHPALSLDLSCTGVALDSATDIPPGTRLLVHFRRPFWPCDQTVSCISRHIQPGPKNQLLRVGLQFEEYAPPIDMLLGTP